MLISEMIGKPSTYYYLTCPRCKSTNQLNLAFSGTRWVTCYMCGFMLRIEVPEEKQDAESR